MRNVSTAMLAAALFCAPVALLSTQASARAGASASHASGGGHGSFSAHAGSAHVRTVTGGGARFIAGAGGANVFTRAGVPTRAAYIKHIPPKFVARVDRHTRHVRGRGGYYGYATGLGVPLVSYGYFTEVGNGCRWLRARYEATGLRKWRLRYQACVAGDDD